MRNRDPICHLTELARMCNGRKVPIGCLSNRSMASKFGQFCWFYFVQISIEVSILEGCTFWAFFLQLLVGCAVDGPKGIAEGAIGIGWAVPQLTWGANPFCHLTKFDVPYGAYVMLFSFVNTSMVSETKWQKNYILSLVVYQMLAINQLFSMKSVQPHCYFFSLRLHCLLFRVPNTRRWQLVIYLDYLSLLQCKI